MARSKFLARDLSIGVKALADTEVDTVGSAQPLTSPFGAAATDILTLSAHGLLDGDLVRFTALTGGAGLATATDYYVRDKTTSTFKVSATNSGNPVNFTTDITAGTLTKITLAWTAIGGLNTLTHSPSTERADTTGFDEDGRPTHLVAQRGDSWSLAGFALLDVTTAVRDPGQQAVETAAVAMSSAAERSYRIVDPAGNKIVFVATAEMTRPGGGHNDPAAWAVTLEVTGAVTYIAGP